MCCFVLTISLRQNWLQHVFHSILICQPGPTGLCIVFSVPLPLINQTQRGTASRKQVDTWHHTAGKKMSSHPVLRPVCFEQVSRFTVAEYMNEQLPIRTQPVMNPPCEFTVVPHMFKHFHGNNSIERFRSRKFSDISRHHLQIRKPPFSCTILDKPTLSTRIRNGSNLT